MKEIKLFDYQEDMKERIEKALRLHRSVMAQMPTGTGKTYVYLKTIYELNKNYGFTKFVIVVPSAVIREGVYKILQITKEHFNSVFNNEPSNYFVYDSSKLDQVRSFENRYI